MKYPRIAARGQTLEELVDPERCRLGVKGYTEDIDNARSPTVVSRVRDLSGSQLWHDYIERSHTRRRSPRPGPAQRRQDPILEREAMRKRTGASVENRPPTPRQLLNATSPCIQAEPRADPPFRPATFLRNHRWPSIGISGHLQRNTHPKGPQTSKATTPPTGIPSS
jgi:hypothetical protein